METATARKADADADAELRRLRRRVAELEAAVAERRRDTEALRRSGAGFRRLYESNIVGVIFADTRGHITEANGAFLEMVGYDRGDLPLRWDEMTPPEWRDLDEAKIAEIAATGVGDPWEKEYIRRDGSRVPILVGVAQLEEGEGEVICFVLDLTERNEHKEKLRALASDLALAEERERRRIGGGLHDHVGHPLAVAKMRLGVLAGEVPSEELARSLAVIEELLDGAIKETRSLSFELSSPILYELGLLEAIGGLGAEILEKNGIRFELAGDLGSARLAEDARVTLYRVVQELLVNVVKHSGARRARVVAERAGEELRVTVEDDGVGLRSSDAGRRLSPSGGLGLFGIRERLHHLGGRLVIEPAAGAGTRVTVAVPAVREREEEP